MTTVLSKAHTTITTSTEGLGRHCYGYIYVVGLSPQHTHTCLCLTLTWLTPLYWRRKGSPLLETTFLHDLRKHFLSSLLYSNCLDLFVLWHRLCLWESLLLCLLSSMQQLMKNKHLSRTYDCASSEPFKTSFLQSAWSLLLPGTSPFPRLSSYHRKG